MGKLVSEKERKLQRKLIPLNIFVCILALVAAFSLVFAPIFKVDFGKILQSDATKRLVDEQIEKIVGDTTEGLAPGDVDFMPVIAAVVSNVLSKAEGKIEFSTFNASKVAFASGDEKANKFLDEMFFGENALVTKLIDSIADNVVGMFQTPEGKAVIEEVVVATLATSLVANLPPEAAEKLTDENITKLTGTYKKLDEVESREDAANAADAFVNELDGILGDDFNKETDGETVKDYILTMYDDTAAVSESFSVETMIAVAVSKNVDLGEFNIDSIIGNLGKKDNEEQPSGSVNIKKTVEGEVGETPDGSEGGEITPPETPDGSEGGEVTPPETPDGSDGGEVTPPETPDGSEGGEVTPPETPDEGEGGDVTPPETPDEGDRVICTSYNDLLKQMGLDDSKMDEVKANLKSSLGSLVNDTADTFSEYFGYYGYAFYGMLAFVAPWLILFLFSFFHLFAKNKRFTMWYVKLYSWIPGFIALAFIVAPKLMFKFAPQMVEGENGELIKTLFSGVSSMMWISGICFVLLWLVSIFWAFPIKHKIRKERKFVKQFGYSGDDGSAGGGANNKGKKGKKGKKNGKFAQNARTEQTPPYYGANQYNQYGAPPYGGQYGGNPYGNQYGNDGYSSNGYGAPPYGGQYGGNPYGNPYGGNYNNYDDDGFDAAYTGSYYGSYYDDDDI